MAALGWKISRLVNTPHLENTRGQQPCMCMDGDNCLGRPFLRSPAWFGMTAGDTELHICEASG